MTYLLDTCLISELVAKKPNLQVLAWLDAQPIETLYLSIITIGEIAKGISKLPESERKNTSMIGSIKIFSIASTVESLALILPR